MLVANMGAWVRGAAAFLRKTTWAERVAALLGVVVLAFTVYTGAVGLYRQGRSREVLAQIKAARLAGSAISASCYASGTPFADNTSADGFAGGVAAEICALGSLPGEVTLLQINPDHYTIERLLYREGEFCALYDAAAGFTVWRGEQRLAYALPAGVS